MTDQGEPPEALPSLAAVRASISQGLSPPLGSCNPPEEGCPRAKCRGWVKRSGRGHGVGKTKRSGRLARRRPWSHPEPLPTRPSPSTSPSITMDPAGAVFSAAVVGSAAITAAASQRLLLHGRRAHSPCLPAPPARHRGKDPHPPCSCRRRQPSIQWFGASQHAAMAASRRRSTSAGNGCLPMQLYDERRKPAPGLAFRGAIGASDGQSGGFICVPRSASSGGC